jgi:hypothetical protein
MEVLELEIFATFALVVGYFVMVVREWLPLAR